MKYKLIIFDMDGTILNTLEDLADCTNYVLRLNHYPEHPIEDIRQFVGNGIRKLIERAVPENTSLSETDKVFSDFKSYYQEHCADKTKPYKGIPELLKTLRQKGCVTAVVSNKADSAVQKLCNDFFEGCFDYAIGDREGIPKKPAPNSILEILDKTGISIEKTVYIGDSDVDIATAGNAGTDHIIVTWGFRSKDFLKKCGAVVFAEHPQDILKLIN